MQQQEYQHMRDEQSSWLKTLERLREDNSQLKNRLAEIMKNDVSKELLDKAELFLGISLNKDAVISILRHDIAKQIAACAVDNLNGSTNRVLKEQDKLRKDVSLMQQELTLLQTDFNNLFGSVN